MYRAAGRTAEAIALLERVRDPMEKKLGADHPTTLGALNNLALAYKAAGRTAEAIALLERVRDPMEKKLGADHPTTLAVLYNLAETYRATGKPEQALPLYQKAAIGVEKGHFRYPHAGWIVGQLIVCHEQLKQYADAEAWRRKWLAVVRERDGPQSVPYDAELVGLGLNLLRQHKHAEAEIALRDCLALRTKQQPDAWATFNVQSMLGDALLGQKRYAEAEPLLKDGYEGMKAREKAIPPPAKARLTEALERLVRLYEAWGKPEQAEPWRRQLEQAKASPKASAK
jgi:tetratricopeptide (TPR) repeat protein